jgi:GNAT superfamily N-acetyltransferase
MDQFSVHHMTFDEVQLALSWAEAEGWNPGINDAQNFYTADPDGFLMGKLNGEPVSCISVVRYPQNFNFIGIYIVKPDYRNQGFGWKTWQEAFKLIPDQPAALDAVLAQVKTYEKSGFKPAHSHLRYQGTIKGEITNNIVDLKNINLEKLCQYDRQYFPSDRTQFLQQWISQPNSQGYAYIKDSQLLGYGLIRKAVDGWKIAPLFSENSDIAEKLLLALSFYARGETIYLDVPNINRKAIQLAENYQTNPMFECVRMYKLDEPTLNWDHIFAVTSLEIG